MTGNQIHPTAIIGPAVRLGSGNAVGPYAVIAGRTTIGNNNWIGPHAAIGTVANSQAAEHTWPWDGPADGVVVVGDGNLIHEHASIQQPLGTETRVGDHCFIGGQAMISHDSQVASRATISMGAALGGHTHVGFGANLGMGSQVHQRVAVGAFAMIGMGSAVVGDIPPCCLAYGSPARVAGLNKVGLGRMGVTAVGLSALAAYFAGDRRAPLDGVPQQVIDELVAWSSSSSSAAGQE